MCISCRINNIAKLPNFKHSRGKKITLGLLDDREDGEYNGVGFAGISSIFLTQESECRRGRLVRAINQCH